MRGFFVIDGVRRDSISALGRSLLLAGLVLGLCPGKGLGVEGDGVADSVPPRGPGGQTLRAPDVHLDAGLIYHVLPGEDTQVVFRSDARLLRIAGTCRRVVGYLVSPFDLEEGGHPVLGGAFRVPVASLTTGRTSEDRILQAKPLLRKADHPEILVRVLSSGPAQGFQEEAGVSSCRVDLELRIEMNGIEKDLTVPCELAFMPCTGATFSRGVGDFLALRSQFSVVSKDFDLLPPDPSYREKLAETIELDVFLMLNTVSPEKSLDPSVKREDHVRRLRYLTLLRDLDRPEEAYKLAHELAQEWWSDPHSLHQLVRITLDDEEIKTLDHPFLQEVMERAVELTAQSDPDVLETLAEIHVDRGDLAAALAVLDRAANRPEADGEEGLKARLEKARDRLRNGKSRRR